MLRWCFVVFCMVPLALPPSAWACSCNQITDDQKFASADMIFRAKVISTQVRPATDLAKGDSRVAKEDAGPKEYIAARFELLETFKGAPDPTQELRSIVYMPGSCVLPLEAGMQYVFFMTKDSQGFASICSGSFACWNDESIERMKEMRALRLRSGRAHPSGTLLHDDSVPIDPPFEGDSDTPQRPSEDPAVQRYAALVAKWRSGVSLDGAALYDAQMHMPGSDYGLASGNSLLVATHVAGYSLQMQTQIVEQALSTAYASVALHTLALRLAERKQDAARVASERRQIAALVQWIASSGDGSRARPWKVLYSADANEFLDAMSPHEKNVDVTKQQSRRGSSLFLIGRHVRLNVLVAAPAAPAKFVARTFAPLFPIAQIGERANSPRPVFLRFTKYLGDAALRGSDPAYADDEAALTALAFALESYGQANTEEAQGIAERLMKLPDYAHNYVAQVASASLRLAQRPDRAPERNGAPTAPAAELAQLAREGVPLAIVQLGNAIERGATSVLSRAEMEALVRRQAEEGVPELQYALGMQLINQGKVSEGETWLQRAADSGSLVAVGRLAWLRSAQGKLADELLQKLREAAALDEPRAVALVALGDLDSRFGVQNSERGRKALLLLAADASDVALVNTLAYGMATGDVLTGAQPSLAVAMFDALFASLPPTRSVAAYVDSRGVALAAAGRRPEALLELARAAELAQTHADALPRHLIERHRQRVSAGESISERTDDEDARSFVAAKVLK